MWYTVHTAVVWPGLMLRVKPLGSPERENLDTYKKNNLNVHLDVLDNILHPSLGCRLSV